MSTNTDTPDQDEATAWRYPFEQLVRRWKKQTQGIFVEVRSHSYFRSRRERLGTKRRRAERRRERSTQETKEVT